MLVSFASLAPFVNDIKYPQTRLPSTCTLILTSVGTRFTIGRLLPTVSYLTSLDKYSLSTMFIITMELLYHALMGAIFPKIPENIGYIIDFVFFGIFCGLVLIKQILFLIWVLKVQKYRNKIREHRITKLNDEIVLNVKSETIETNLLSFGKVWQLNHMRRSSVNTNASTKAEKINDNQQPLIQRI
jgi:hypothetical protein